MLLCNQFTQSSAMLVVCVHIVTAVRDVAAVGVRETRKIPGNKMIKYSLSSVLAY